MYKECYFYHKLYNHNRRTSLSSLILWLFSWGILFQSHEIIFLMKCWEILSTQNFCKFSSTHFGIFFQFVGCFSLLAVHLVRYFTIIVWTTDRLIFITIILSLYNWSWAVFRSVWTWAVIVYLLKFDEHFVGVRFENINAIVYKILRTQGWFQWMNTNNEPLKLYPRYFLYNLQISKRPNMDTISRLLVDWSAIDLRNWLFPFHYDIISCLFFR